jgi:hypothetical protein
MTVLSRQPIDSFCLLPFFRSWISLVSSWGDEINWLLRMRTGGGRNTLDKIRIFRPAGRSSLGVEIRCHNGIGAVKVGPTAVVDLTLCDQISVSIQ